MKFCYVDESGTGDEPFAVMVGVVVDALRMRPTKADWEELLEDLRSKTGAPFRELHTRDFYSGNGAWRNIPGDKRALIIGSIFDWLAERKHQIVYATVDKERFSKLAKLDIRLKEINTVWRYLGLHLVLSLQKCFQKTKNNKGNTVLVMDNEERERSRFTDFVLSPPAWTETYYAREKKKDPLDQIIDVPYFADSAHVPLLQAADFVAYFLRRHCELEDGHPDRYKGEADQVSGWVSKAVGQSITKSAIYPKVGRCDCADLFYSLAPSCLRD